MHIAIGNQSIESFIRELNNIDNEKYITLDWLKSCFGKACCNCGDSFIFEVKHTRPISNLTADRKDNKIAHAIDNISPLCITCNTSLSNRG